MVDSGHCFMNSSEFDQYEDFYDFASENRKIAERLQNKFKGMKEDESTFIYKITEKKVEDVNEDDSDYESWESVDEELEGSDIEEEDLEAEKVSLKKEYFKLRRAKILSSGEMRLPSGKIAGHRDYIRYYKQKLRIKEDENPVKQLMRDRAMKRRFISLQMGLVAKAQGLAGVNQLMVKNYGTMLARLKKKMDRSSRRRIKYEKRRWVK